VVIFPGRQLLKVGGLFFIDPKVIPLAHLQYKGAVDKIISGTACHIFKTSYRVLRKSLQGRNVLARVATRVRKMHLIIMPVVRYNKNKYYL
jgi:hypothetical protein